MRLSRIFLRPWLAAAALLTCPAALVADESADPVTLDPVTIIGTPEAATMVTGGATVITEDDLQKFEFTDIQRILRQVPGVSIQLEDGFGLRPNISIRGTASDRSRAITLMEDGILIAPAPYSAPAAYYFPTAGRLQGVEVLKGPAAILHGPYTTGGAVNLISTRIPARTSGQAQLEAGSDGHLRGHAWYGGSFDRGGFMVEGHEWRSDGFQSIDRSSRDTGLDKGDYLARFRVNTDPGAPQYHALELKLQYSEEDSNFSYLGLTDEDFRARPFRRYGVSELDRFENEHSQAVLTWTGQFSRNFLLRVSAYNNDTERDWFKTETIDLDGSPNAQEFSGVGWFNVIQAVNRGESIGGFGPDELQAILDGALDTAPGAIELRHNAREYYSRGLQGETLSRWILGPSRHELTAGARLHRDEEDRFQQRSSYTQINGTLVLDDPGLPGNAGNRIERARAWSAWVYDRIELDRLTLTPGVRFESVSLRRVRFEDRIGRTDDPGSRAEDNLRDIRRNRIDVWLPGLGLKYRLTRPLNLIAGVHKGFSAPSSDPSAREEESTNGELGMRYNDGIWFVEAIGFYNDYENLVGVCTASSGTGCEVGELFSGDAVRVRGLEFRLDRDLSPSPLYGLPFQLTYTYSDGEFRSDLADSSFFGDAAEGDPLPYLPDHQLYVSIGYERPRFAAYASLNWIDDMCAFASCDEFEQIDSATIVDLALHYDLTHQVQLYGLARNLFEEDGIAGRQPRGARPNLDRTFITGLRFRF